MAMRNQQNVQSCACELNLRILLHCSNHNTMIIFVPAHENPLPSSSHCIRFGLDGNHHSFSEVPAPYPLFQLLARYPLLISIYPSKYNYLE